MGSLPPQGTLMSLHWVPAEAKVSRKQAAGVRLTELSAKLFSPSLVDSPLEMILLQGVASRLLASEIPVF